MHAENGNVSVSLKNGAADVAPIVRALDEAGLLVESLDVIEPTLDDVFLATTGQTLEGSADAAATNGADPQHAATEAR
jgi:ABC-2 type transport system ATP-binding protein